MSKKCLSGLILTMILLLVIPKPYAFASPFETMALPPEDIPWQALGDQNDIYLVHKANDAVSVRAQKKGSAKTLYHWRSFALRAIDYDPAAAWHKVALPGADGFVKSGQTSLLPEDGRPRLKAYIGTASLGYVYIAASGKLPLVMEITANNKCHQLLLPNNGIWQPVLLALGAGDYTLSVYEAGLYDRPIRLLFTTSLTLPQAVPDTQLALYSSLHTNMEENAVTVALARSLCKNAKDDNEKVTLLWNWLIDHASYDKALSKSIQFSEIPDSDAFIRGEKGICSDYAAFMAVGLRAVGVPAKHIYGKNLRTGNQHAWNEVYLSGKWQIIDATMAQSRGPKKFHTEDAKHYGAEVGLWDGYH